MSTVQVSRTTSTVEVSATRPRVEVGTPSLVQHNDLDGRDAAGAHHIGAITGLLPLPTDDGSRWTVSHPGGANPPAWSKQGAWKDQPNTFTQVQLFPAGSAASPSVAIGTSGDGFGRYATGVVSASVSGVERFRFQSDRLIINANASPWYSPGIASLGLNGLSFYGADGVAIGLGGSAVGNDVRFIGRRANGTALVPTAILSAEDMLNIQASGYDGSAFTGDRARITAEASENWTNAAHGTRWRFYVCANGATALSEVFQINNDGQSQASSGTASLPGISFLSDTDTGAYRGGSNIFGIATGGTLALQIDASQNISPKDGGNVILGATTGTKIGTATTQKLGFWNATPVVQPAAAAQAAPASQGQASLTDSTGGTASTTLAAITAGAAYAQADMSAVKNALASIAARLAEVRTDVANIKTFQNAARTALVNTGLIKGAA